MTRASEGLGPPTAVKMQAKMDREQLEKLEEKLKAHGVPRTHRLQYPLIKEYTLRYLPYLRDIGVSGDYFRVLTTCCPSDAASGRAGVRSCRPASRLGS